MSETARAMGSFKRHLEHAIGEEAADVVVDELVTKSWLRDELARQLGDFRHEMDRRFGEVDLRFDALYRHIDRQMYMTVGLVSLVAVLLRLTL